MRYLPGTGPHGLQISVFSLSLVLVVIIAWVDGLVGPLVNTGILYVGPVALAAWYCGRTPAMFLAVAAVLLWLANDTDWLTTGFGPYQHLWNSLMRLLLVTVTAHLVSSLRSKMHQLKLYADHDSLTNLRNRRSFIELLSKEHDRLARFRHPLSLAYIDLDNFKEVNDGQGHAEGDRVLCTVAEILGKRGRRTDVAARLGGDEFALLLVETDGAAAVAAVRSLNRQLSQAMAAENWPVTFSIGVVTFYSPADSVDEVLNSADQLMYIVKRSHKNGILYQCWEAGGLTPPAVASV